MRDMCDYTAGLGIDFEICMFEELSRFCVPLHGVRTREERRWEYGNQCVKPDLTFRYDGRVFHVDCHYRQRITGSAAELDHPGIYRFKERCFENVRGEIFEAYAIGGTPYDPEHMIFVPKKTILGNRIPLRRFARMESDLERMGLEGLVYMYMGSGTDMFSNGWKYLGASMAAD